RKIKILRIFSIKKRSWNGKCGRHAKISTAFSAISNRIHIVVRIEIFLLSEKEYRNIVRRMETFQNETGHKGGVQASIVTTYGLNENVYSEISPVPITMDELFG
ncbi:MAG: hypothetical protein IJS19_04690, partial [Muribaculaceae bacterium]|nr:hypothetical protein [Muribaculaceae bacterium]